MNRSRSGYGQLAGSCERGNGTSDSIYVGNFLSSSETISFSRRTLVHASTSWEL
jgi:hypothetical protein